MKCSDCGQEIVLIGTHDCFQRQMKRIEENTKHLKNIKFDRETVEKFLRLKK